jgi:hypothetical protein
MIGSQFDYLPFVGKFNAPPSFGKGPTLASDPK